MSMRRWTTGLLALLVALSFSVPAFAQGGGASSTGTIQGRVADAQGAVLARRDGDRHQPRVDSAADHGDVGNGQLPLPGGASGHLRAQLTSWPASTP